MRNTKNVKTIPEVIEYFEKAGYEVDHTLGEDRINMNKDGVQVFFHARSTGYEFEYANHKLKNLKTMLKKADEEVNATNSRKNTENRISVLTAKTRKSFELAGISFEGYSNSCEREWISGHNNRNGRWGNTVKASINLKDFPKIFGESEYSDNLTLRISLAGSKRWTISVADTDKLSIMQEFIDVQADYFESLSL